MCNDMERAIANKRYLLYHGGIFRRDWFSDKLEENGNVWKKDEGQETCWVHLTFQWWRELREPLSLDGDHRRRHNRYLPILYHRHDIWSDFSKWRKILLDKISRRRIKASFQFKQGTNSNFSPQLNRFERLKHDTPNEARKILSCTSICTPSSQQRLLGHVDIELGEDLSTHQLEKYFINISPAACMTTAVRHDMTHTTWNRVRYFHLFNTLHSGGKRSYQHEAPTVPAPTYAIKEKQRISWIKYTPSANRRV